MNRRELRQLAELRIREAQALLRSRCPAGAYYLAGYAVECALKACIARQTRRYQFPDRDRARKAWTHDLEALVDLAGLRGELIRQTRSMLANWRIVKDWTEASRYNVARPTEARELIRAIAEKNDGVLPWLSRHW